MWATLLSVQTPACAWCRVASLKHPDVGLRVTSYYARPDHSALEVVEMTGAGWPQAVEEIRKISTVEEVEVLESSEKSSRVRIAASECHLPGAIEASGIVPQIPFDISHGCDKWLVLSEQSRARAFYENLTTRGVAVEVVYSGEYAPEARLTPRQQEILAFAVKHGYYDYPRRITLTHLAEKLGIAKSSLSQTLMLVESEVVKRAAVPAGRPEPGVASKRG